MIDFPSTHVIIAGDFNAHVFDDVASISTFDHVFRAVDKELREDGFCRFPEVGTLVLIYRMD